MLSRNISAIEKSYFKTVASKDMQSLQDVLNNLVGEKSMMNALLSSEAHQTVKLCISCNLLNDHR